MNGRRVFVEVAAALRAARPARPDAQSGNSTAAAWAQWRADVHAVSDAFVAMNSAFDSARFWQDCHEEMPKSNGAFLADAELVIRHANRFGNLRTADVLKAAGSAGTLLSVPADKLPALRARLQSDLGETP